MKSKPVASTGIEGLDHILLGGFPRNHVYLLQGDPGVGKTTLGLQIDPAQLQPGAGRDDQGHAAGSREDQTATDVFNRFPAEK